MDYKKHIATKLANELISIQEIQDLLVVPPEIEMGDLSLPCFKFAKALRKAPVMIAEDFKQRFDSDEYISSVENVNGYLNFKFNKTFYSQ